jgi:hypothetical protein
MRVWPVATAGRLGAYAYDATTRSFALSAVSTGAGRRGSFGNDTEISIPSTVHGAVAVAGSALLDAVVTRPDGSRLAFVTTKGPTTAPATTANYAVTVGTPPASLRDHVEQESLDPPAPISEPVARAMAESALQTEAQSPDASIRSTAQLIEGLATIVLGTTDPNGSAF